MDNPMIYMIVNDGTKLYDHNRYGACQCQPCSAVQSGHSRTELPLDYGHSRDQSHLSRIGHAW